MGYQPKGNNMSCKPSITPPIPKFKSNDVEFEFCDVDIETVLAENEIEFEFYDNGTEVDVIVVDGEKTEVQTLPLIYSIERC